MFINVVPSEDSGLTIDVDLLVNSSAVSGRNDPVGR